MDIEKAYKLLKALEFINKIEDPYVRSLVLKLFDEGKIQVVFRKGKPYIRKAPVYYTIRDIETLRKAPLRKLAHMLAFTETVIKARNEAERKKLHLADGYFIPDFQMKIKEKFPETYQKIIERYKNLIEREEKRKKIEKLIQIIEKATGRKFIGEERKKLERELEVLV